MTTKELKKKLDDKLENELIKTSKMVSDGRLSSSGGKEVAQDLISRHKQGLNALKEIEALEEREGLPNPSLSG